MRRDLPRRGEAGGDVLMADPSIAALQATLELLMKQIERLLAASERDHDAVVKLQEQMRQAFIEIKAIRVAAAEHVEVCSRQHSEDPEKARADERARAEERNAEREWREDVIRRLTSLEGTRTVVQSQGVSLLKLGASGVFGGGMVRLLDWLAGFLGGRP